MNMYHRRTLIYIFSNETKNNYESLDHLSIHYLSNIDLQSNISDSELWIIYAEGRMQDCIPKHNATKVKY